MFEVSIKGPRPSDPRQRILAIEAATKAICDEVGQDPADGVMMLLTAAAHISMRHSEAPPDVTAKLLAAALGDAIVAADGFFKLRPAALSPRNGGERE
jgi:hypothetical protein